MALELTETQRQAVSASGGAAVEVLDAASQTPYVLLPKAVWQRVRALLQGDEFDPAEAYPLMDAVASREGWLDPAMDAYDALDPRREPSRREP